MNITILPSLDDHTDSDAVSSRCIVRLRTTYWEDGRGINVSKRLTYLRRRCLGHNYLEEDVSNIGAEQVFFSITNLEECVDGIYEVVPCNIHRDFESGHIEDWKYALVKFDDSKGTTNETHTTF